MQRRSHACLAAIGFTALTTAAWVGAPAAGAEPPHIYTAIAYSDEMNVAGTGTAGLRPLAIARAKADCDATGASDCEVVQTAYDACVAVVSTEASYAAMYGDTADEAIEGANAFLIEDGQSEGETIGSVCL